MHAKKILILVAALSVLPVSVNQPAFCSPARSPKRTAALASPATSAHAAIRAKLDALQDCVAKGDATKMTKLWAEDGHYIDEEGSEYSGRSALEKNFASIFAEHGQRQAEIIADSIRFPSNNVAMVKGTVKRILAGESIPVTRYSMIFTKQKGDWLISSATETPIVAHATVNPLHCLDWLIGDWSAERDGASVTMKAEWVPSQNFIFCRYEIKKSDQPLQMETQVIGWDPRTQSPISWNFDSNGGFGQGRWSKRNNQWLVDASGVERNGSVTISTNVYSVSDPNSFSWQSTNRHINGSPVADTLPLKVQRLVK